MCTSRTCIVEEAPVVKEQIAEVSEPAAVEVVAEVPVQDATTEDVVVTEAVTEDKPE